MSRDVELGKGNNASDLSDSVLELNFVPDWARKPPGEVHFSDRSTRRPENRNPHADRRDGGRKSGRRDGLAKRKDPVSSQKRRVPLSRDADRRPRLEMPAVEVRFLPERKRLKAVLRQVQLSKRAYPLRDMADLFLTKENSCDVRFECRDEEKTLKLFQCSLCKTATLDRAAMVDHFVDSHREDYFDAEERTVDPPSGKFACIALCGLSGVILGPPNHHSYAEKIQEIYKTRFSNMPLEKYKEQIKTSREEALIEQWKEENSKKTVYRLRGDSSDEVVEMDWAAAEAYISGTVVSSAVIETRSLIMPLSVARKIKDGRLVLAAKEAWKKENRFPVSLTVALRGAFRSKKLSLFRVGKEAVFVSSVQPVPMDRKHVVADILEVLAFLDDHPGCTRAELLKSLHPDLVEGASEAVRALTPLSWLIEKGHIIEFYNGTLSVPKRRR